MSCRRILRTGKVNNTGRQLSGLPFLPSLNNRTTLHISSLLISSVYLSGYSSQYIIDIARSLAPMFGIVIGV